MANNTNISFHILQNGTLPVGTGMFLGISGLNTNAFWCVETQPMLLTTADYYEIQLTSSDNATITESDATAFSLYTVG